LFDELSKVQALESGGGMLDGIVHHNQIRLLEAMLNAFRESPWALVVSSLPNCQLSRVCSFWSSFVEKCLCSLVSLIDDHVAGMLSECFAVSPRAGDKSFADNLLCDPVVCAALPKIGFILSPTTPIA